MPNPTHPISPEELMAYFDGELAPARASEALEHLQSCEECKRLAEDLRVVSREMSAWEVEAVEFGRRTREDAVAPIPLPRRWRAWAGIAAAVVLGCLGLATLSRMRVAETDETVSWDPVHRWASANPQPAPRRLAVPSAQATTATAPLIARTAEISLVAADFGKVRAQLDAILTARAGYASQLSVSTPGASSRSIEGSVSVPSAQLDATLADLRKLGRVQNESQNGTDVTAQSVDLDARLSNARNTERRMTQLISDRSGGLKDVLAVEVELSRVRGEIEAMEAQQKSLATQVARATITVHITEEERTQLSSNNLGLRFRNAVVEGWRVLSDSVIGAILFGISRGPVLLLWAAILFFPVRFAWRWWGRSRR